MRTMQAQVDTEDQRPEDVSKVQVLSLERKREEKIERWLDSLPSVPMEDWKSLPNVSAVYLFVDAGNEIKYIGQSERLAFRFISHDARKILRDYKGITIKWIETPVKKNLVWVEAELIERFTPTLNRAVGNPKDLIPMTLTKTKKKDGFVPVNPQSKREGMTVKEVAKELGVTLKYVKDLLYEGRFEGARKDGGRWLIPRASFVEFQKKREEKRKEN